MTSFVLAIDLSTYDMMWTETLTEIRSYFRHGDYPLAIRRTLDATFDSDNRTLIRRAITWGNTGHALLDNNKVPDENFIREGEDILVQLESSEAQKSPAYGIDFLQANQVQKTYTSGHFSLKPMDFTIKAGEVVGVVGENGNGKTTLLRILSGYLNQNTGELRYYFQENDMPHYYRVKNEVAFIPQRIPRWFGSLKDNLHFYASSNGFLGEENELMTDFMLARFGLTKFSNLTWNQLSSGYRTRFEIAKILLKRPKLLVLDEPLANLDINAQQTILNDLRVLSKSFRKPLAVVLSSQQLHEVEKIADKVLFLKNGQLLHTQTKEVEADTVIEIEIKNERVELENAMEGIHFQIKYNGGYYMVSSTNISSTDLVKLLFQKGIIVTYFRDISQSTKRFF